MADVGEQAPAVALQALGQAAEGASGAGVGAGGPVLEGSLGGGHIGQAPEEPTLLLEDVDLVERPVEFHQGAKPLTGPHDPPICPMNQILTIGDVGTMIKNAEERVSKFYNTVGWEEEGEITEDARRWEDLREYAKEYVSKCRLRVLCHIPKSGENILDMASGPIQYKEYLEYSKNFKKRYCVDLSLRALESAKKKIGDHGVFLHGSFFDISFRESFFDCTVSLHTIYHIDKDRQEEAVRKLIYVTKPGRPIIIVYRNPNTFVSVLKLPFRLLGRVKSVLKKTERRSKQEEGPGLYLYAHPIEWWDRFNDIASIRILFWRSFNSEAQKILIPNNKIGRQMLDVLFNLEERFPDFFVRHFQYPMIILTKRKS